MGGEVNPELATVSYNGKNYDFCCKECKAKFKAEPEKYATNLDTKFIKAEE